jgi:undecaprenyl-diphosphatase
MRFPDHPFRLLSGSLAVAVAASMLFLDRPVIDAMRHIDPAWLPIIETVTGFGKSTGYLIILGAATAGLAAYAHFGKDKDRQRWARRWAWLCVYLFLAVAVPGLLNDLLKIIVGRPRPLVEATGISPFTFGYAYASFPSGHASTSFGLAFALGLLWPMLRWPALACAAAIAASRVLLNVHHLSDVLASIILALLTIHWLTAAFARRGLVFTADGEGRPVAFTRRITPA